MSNRINQQTNVITAGKFVKIGTDSVSARSKLRNVLSSYVQLQNTLETADVQKILLDNKITPEEKVTLKERWDSLSAAYSSLLSALQDNGLEGMTGVAELRNYYSSLYVNIQNLLADMDSESAAPSNFQSNFDAFNQQLTIVSQAYANVAYRVNEFKVQLTTSHYYLGEGETAEIKAELYKGISKYSGTDYDSIMDTIDWTVTGATVWSETSDEDGNPLVKIPYENFENEVHVSATVQMTYEELS